MWRPIPSIDKITFVPRVEVPVSPTRLDELRRLTGVKKRTIGDKKWRDLVDPLLPLLPFRPASRAYHKLAEILDTYPTPSRALCLCEAPGGFAQYLSLRGTSVIACSLNLVRTAPTVLGDITLKETRARLGKNYDLITADGSVENDKVQEDIEVSNAHIIACQLRAAMDAQAIGGIFVLKFFGGRQRVTRDIISIVAHVYSTCVIVKPHSSRVTNDERYLVANGFKGPISFDMDLMPREDDPGILKVLKEFDQYQEKALHVLLESK